MLYYNKISKPCKGNYCATRQAFLGSQRKLLCNATSISWESLSLWWINIFFKSVEFSLHITFDTFETRTITLQVKAPWGCYFNVEYCERAARICKRRYLSNRTLSTPYLIFRKNYHRSTLTTKLGLCYKPIVHLRWLPEIQILNHSIFNVDVSLHT